MPRCESASSAEAQTAARTAQAAEQQRRATQAAAAEASKTKALEEMLAFVAGAATAHYC